MRALRETVDGAAERCVVKGVLHCGPKAFPAYAREGLTPGDFSDTDVGALYAYCLGRFERSVPTTLVDVYRGVRWERDRYPANRGRPVGPLGGYFFGPPFALWLADAFDCDWWPQVVKVQAVPDDDPLLTLPGLADLDDLPQPLWVATVAARWVRRASLRRAELIRTATALDKAVAKTLSGEFNVRHPEPVPVDRPADPDDAVETRGPG